jgi:hypothetical protein
VVAHAFIRAPAFQIYPRSMRGLRRRSLFRCKLRCWYRGGRRLALAGMASRWRLEVEAETHRLGRGCWLRTSRSHPYLRHRFQTPHIYIYGDNSGVVEGWWNGRSPNWEINSIFRRIHALSSSSGITFHTRYVRSRANPADGPSRGDYGSTSLLLPPLSIPVELAKYIVSYDAAISETPAKPIPKSFNSTPRPYEPNGRDEWLAEFVQFD